MRSRRFLHPTWLVGLVAALTVWAQAQPQQPAKPSIYTPYQHRAWYLYLSAQYTDWPADAFPDDTSPFVLGILGENPFRKEDIDVIRNKPLKNRKLVVQQLRNVSEIQQCQVLYVCDSEKGRLAQIFEALASASILTFGEMEGFIQPGAQGGIVKFWIEEKTPTEGYLLFEINQAAAEKARLRISSRVLKLAKPEKKPNPEKEKP